MNSFTTVSLVTRREIRERGRSKAYLLSSLFTLLLLVGLIVVPAMLSGQTTSHQVGVVGEGHQPIITAAEALTAPSGDEERQVEFVITRYATVEEAETALGEGEVTAVLVDGSRLLTAKTGGFTGGELESILQQAAGSQRIQRLLAENGEATADVLEILTSDALEESSLTGLDEQENQTRGLIAYGGLLLMYIAVLTYGAYTLTGVTEEKSTRVVEVLLATVKPWQLLAGKITGIGVLGLLQFVVTIVAGFIAIQLTGVVEMPSLPIDSVLILALWFVLGYAVYSVAFGTAGSLVSRAEEAQNAAGPITLVAVGGFFASFAVLGNPDNLLASVFTFIPVTAPFVVPIRFAFGAIPWWEMALAVIVTMAVIAVMVRVAGRIYAGGLLQFGGKIKMRQAYRSAEM